MHACMYVCMYTCTYIYSRQKWACQIVHQPTPNNLPQTKWGCIWFKPEIHMEILNGDTHGNNKR